MAKFLITIDENTKPSPFLADFAEKIVLTAESLSAVNQDKLLRKLRDLYDGSLPSFISKNAPAHDNALKTDVAISQQALPAGLQLPFSVLGQGDNSNEIRKLLDTLPLSMLCLKMSLVEQADKENSSCKILIDDTDWVLPAQIVNILPTYLTIELPLITEQQNWPMLKAKLSTLIDKVAVSGFQGLFLLSQSLPVETRVEAIDSLGALILLAKKRGLEAGIIGGLQYPDIPRLLPFAPDYLGFAYKKSLDHEDSAKNITSNIITSRSELSLVRELIPMPDANGVEYQAENEKNIKTDKILVSDFIVPVHIGLYAHERKKAQSVCFNVTAEVLRFKHSDDIRHIFSYDIIMDAILRLTQQGHIELVETLAEELADFLLQYPQVQKTIIRVEKLDLAPRAIGVEIMRRKR